MKGKKMASVLVAALAITVILAVPAFAAEPVDVTSVMTTAFQTMVDNMLTTIAAVLPICLTVLGLSVTVGFGIKWFKRLTGNV